MTAFRTTEDEAAAPRRSVPWAESWRSWLVLLSLGVAAVFVAQLLPAGVARAVVALPPVLLIPGFTLWTLVQGRTRPQDPAVVVVFSMTLSFAVLIFNALALNALGIRLSGLSLGLGALVCTGVVIGAACAAGLTPANPKSTARVRSALTIKAVVLVVSLAAVVGVVSLVATHIPAPASTPFTSVSLGGSWAGAANPPRVTTGQRVTIPVVAATQHNVAGTYELTTSIDGAVSSTQSVTLSPSATWRGQVTVVAPAGRALHRVVIVLRASTSPSTDDGQVIVYLDNEST